jgi:hypothetical protein
MMVSYPIKIMTMLHDQVNPSIRFVSVNSFVKHSFTFRLVFTLDFLNEPTIDASLDSSSRSSGISSTIDPQFSSSSNEFASQSNASTYITRRAITIDINICCLSEQNVSIHKHTYSSRLQIILLFTI